MQLEQLSCALCFGIWNLFFWVYGSLKSGSFFLAAVRRSLISGFPHYPHVNSCSDMHFMSNKERKSEELIYSTTGLFTSSGLSTDLQLDSGLICPHDSGSKIFMALDITLAVFLVSLIHHYFDQLVSQRERISSM